MATFGRTLITLDNSSGLNDALVGGKATCPGAGVANSITMYMSCYAAGRLVRCALYETDGTFLFETEERVIGNVGLSSQTFNFVAPPAILAQDYVIVGWADNTCSLTWLANGGTLRYSRGGKVYNGFPEVTWGIAAGLMNIYCTYTPAVGGPAIFSPFDPIKAILLGDD